MESHPDVELSWQKLLAEIADDVGLICCASVRGCGRAVKRKITGR